MARKPKQKLLTQLPAKFDPDFIDRLSKRYSLTHIVTGRLQALEAHCGGDLSYIQRSLIKRTVWLELLTESYEQKVASGEQIDVGALTQLNNSLKGLYKDLGIKSTARPVQTLDDLRAEIDAEEEREAARTPSTPDPEPGSESPAATEANPTLRDYMAGTVDEPPDEPESDSEPPAPESSGEATGGAP